MASEVVNGDAARSIAERVYALSEECLMAHSIRAVERYLLETYRIHTPIVLKLHPQALTEFGRLSFCSVATATGFPTVIWVQSDADHNHRRFCIAHELYHVICAISSSSESVPRSRYIEDVCDLFANELCRRHHEFHIKPETQARLRFDGLPYRSTTAK